MTPERWRRIEQLYHDALEHEPGERSAFVAGVCQDDEEMQRELISLLAPIKPPMETEVTPGTLFGPYKIECILGTGGMGKVYRASDARLRRTVAIKVLPRGKVADPERKSR